jgi:23S rRNA (adenine2503-C2)-methyltransferase
MQHDINNYTSEELRGYFIRLKLPKFCATQVFEWVYKKKVQSFNAMTNLSKPTRQILEKYFYFSNLVLLKEEISRDTTKKFLWGLKDNFKIESVLIPKDKRLTLCVSTQVGCKFACKFCLSGQAGFKRNLSAAEIVGQYLEITHKPPAQEITNIVFMGIGEPLDNFDNTVKAIKIFREPQGLFFAKRRICLSTCGLAPQIKELAKLKLGIKLSVSLHSANDTVRSRLMPINKKYPLADLVKAVEEFTKDEKYPVTFEYALISGINAGKKDAVELIHLVQGINCKINLIPYNLSGLEFKAPSLSEINAFTQILKEKHIPFTLRQARGEDINAACGQLRAIWR